MISSFLYFLLLLENLCIQFWCIYIYTLSMCLWKMCMCEKIQTWVLTTMLKREKITNNFEISCAFLDPISLCSYKNNAILSTTFLIALCPHNPTPPAPFTHVNIYLSKDCLLLHHFELHIDETILYLYELAFFCQFSVHKFYQCDICVYMSFIFTIICPIYECTTIYVCILL